MALGSQTAEHQIAAGGTVYVWELPVRIAHWTIVLTIGVLTVTGLYMHAPFVAPAPGEATPSVMATVRFVHELAGIAFTIAVGFRVYWSLVGNRYARWQAVVPHTRAQWRSLRNMLAYYTFRRSSPPPAIGHNALAGLAYSILYLGFVGQVLTGLMLFGFLLGTGPVAFLFGWVHLVPGGIQTVRLVHYLLTFAFLAFTIHHVYSAVLIDLEERNGLLSSIVTGVKGRAASWRRTHGETPDA